VKSAAFSVKCLQRGVGHLLRGVGAEKVGSAVHGMHGLAVGPVAGVDGLEGFVED
jgi:hypothetical protein